MDVIDRCRCRGPQRCGGELKFHSLEAAAVPLKEELNRNILLTLLRELAAMEATVVRVDNRMQQGYSYFRTCDVGDLRDLEERYGFRPDLTPKEMLSLGVFGGKYFNDVVETDEYPSDWWDCAKLSGLGNPPSAELNFFGVLASSPLAEWRRKGWILDQDPRGWFEWYARTYMGRRSPDDQRQARRHAQFKRHLSQLRRNCYPRDFQCRPKQRQALLQWAYDARRY